LVLRARVIFCVVNVATCVVRTWHELGTVDLDANCYGAELRKLTKLNFKHDLDIEKCVKMLLSVGSILRNV
jgi:hypothetical protein